MIDSPVISDHRKDFPILNSLVNGLPLVYFDNGATSQKPQQVIDAISNFYESENANIHRGVHSLSQLATEKYEAARSKSRAFINAKHDHEIIFTKGTTDGINLIASSLKLSDGDEVLISAMEHHSNIVPWQMACERTGAQLKVIPMNEHGELILNEAMSLINEKTAIVSCVHVSNSMGTINPVEEIIAKAQACGALVLLDGAQAVPHQQVDMQALNCDFYVFSAHKMFGPTGVGVLYGKEDVLNSLPPYQGGGDMIKTVTFEKTTYNELPHKFEAGTPNIAGGIGLGAAIDYINQVGYDHIHSCESQLLAYATKELKAIDGIKIIGDNDHKAAVISFIVDGIHPYDIGMILDKLGVAIRTGHHCTQPLMDFFGVPGTCRASFCFYNTTEEIDTFIVALKKAISMLR